MDERIRFLQGLEPRNMGLASHTAILEAAAGLFQRFPAEAITLRDILTLSGVSNQTLYNYFPAGRDDVVIALFDRFQQDVVSAFGVCNQAIPWDTLPDTEDITRALSASLARATIGNLRENRPLQAAILDYLKAHRLGSLTTHNQGLEEALSREILLRYGLRFLQEELARVVRLSARVVCEIAEVAMAHPEFPIESMESKARKMLRTLLRSGLKGGDPNSGGHEFFSDSPAPAAIVGAPISQAKRQMILARILKRKRKA
jgi:AcrR family transcriptional regulator